MPKEEKVPFMVSVLLAFGAWLACLTALFFFALRNMVWFGLGFILAAAVCQYIAGKTAGVRRAFALHASLAFSLFGKGLLFFGMSDLWGLNAGSCFILLAVMAALSYPLFTLTIDRAITVLAAVLCGFAWLWEWHVPPIWLETFSVGLFGLAYGILINGRAVWRPLAWGILPACAAPLGFCVFLSDTGALFGGWNQTLLGSILCAFYAWQTRRNFNILLAAFILLLAFISNSGVCMGAALLALGFAQKSRMLQIAGAGAFAAALCWLYYQMQTTLLIKAGYLCTAGILLMGTYVWLKRGKYAR